MKKYIGLFLLITLIVLPQAMAFAEEQPPQILAIDAAIAAKDTNAMLSALNAISDDTQKADAEKQILDAARNLVFNEDIDTASKFAETVLLFDFMNADAQELYLSIEDQKTARAKLEERKKAEAEEREKERKTIEARDELAKKEAERQQRDKEFLESVTNIGIGNFSASAAISPCASMALYSSPFADAYSGTSTLQKTIRLPLELSGRFTHPYVIASLKARGALTIAPLGSAERLTDFSARISVGTPLTGIPVCVTGGIAGYSLARDDGAPSTTALFGKIVSPSIGISLENVKLGDSVDLTASLQWLAASTNTPYLNAAFTGELSSRIFIGEPGSLRFFVSPSVTGILSVSGEKSEWFLMPGVFAGVLINEYR